MRKSSATMRVVLFVDARTVTTVRMVRAALRWAQGHPSREIAGFVTTRPEVFRPGPLEAAGDLLRRAVVAVSNRDVPLASVVELLPDPLASVRRRGVPVLVPPSGNPNDPEFIAERIVPLRGDLAFSCYCGHRFKHRLRSVFEHTLNYHDGRVPDYRGVMTTGFSILAGEPASGFTFHRMSARFDAGPVLFEASVRVQDGDTLATVVRRKSRAAASALAGVLQSVADGAPGSEQRGEPRYFSGDDWRAWIHLSRPENATRGEIERRIRAFGIAYITIGDEVYPATRVRPGKPGGRRSFRTADGQWIMPDRFHGLPFWLRGRGES